MKKFLLNNFAYKIVSIFVAITIWVIVINVVRPIVSGFVTVPITVSNETALETIGKTYNIDNTSIRVTYNVSSEQVNAIRQSDFVASVDLSSLVNAETDYLPVYVVPMNNVEKIITNLDWSPKNIHVSTDVLTSKILGINYNLIGNLPSDLSVGNVVLSPTHVYAIGSEMELSSIKELQIDIRLTNKEENFSGVATPKLIGLDNQVVTKHDLSLSADEINYSVSVYLNKSVTLNAVVDGTVRNGYSYAGAIVSPNTLSISGPRSIITELYYIDLPTINIDDLYETTEWTFPITDIIPLGLRVNNNITEVAVKATINKIDILPPPDRTDRRNVIISPGIEAPIRRDEQTEIIETTTDSIEEEEISTSKNITETNIIIPERNRQNEETRTIENVEDAETTINDDINDE